MKSSRQVPEWLLTQQEIGMCPCGCIGKRKKANFLEKTIDDVAKIIKNVIFSEDIAFRTGFLQKLDPRVKVFTTLTLIFTTVLIHNLSILFFLYLTTCVMAYFSKISLSFFIKRVWLVIPIFTGIMVLPSLLNIVRPGDTLFTLINFGHQIHIGPLTIPAVLTITKQGVWGAVLLIVRVGVSVSLAVLLTLTTRWTNLLKAFRILLMPKIFIMVLEMSYRYIFILLNITIDMFIARKSRTVGKINSKEGRRFISNAIGSLFGKSFTLSEEIYAAMLSRGYTGEPKLINKFKFTILDFQWVIIVFIVILTAYGGDMYFGR